MEHSPVVMFLVAIILFPLSAAVTEPVPNCVSPYGIRDDTVCVYAGYPYDHGTQVG